MISALHLLEQRFCFVFILFLLLNYFYKIISYFTTGFWGVLNYFSPKQRNKMLVPCNYRDLPTGRHIQVQIRYVYAEFQYRLPQLTNDYAAKPLN